MSRKKCVGIPTLARVTEKILGNFSPTKKISVICVRQIFLVKLQEKFQFTILTEIFLVKLQLKFFLTKRKLSKNCSKLNKNVTFTTHFFLSISTTHFFLHNINQNFSYKSCKRKSCCKLSRTFSVDENFLSREIFLDTVKRNFP